MGRSVVVMGNGKSLSEFDFVNSTIDTIGMNRAFRYWREVDWFPTYYACLDENANVEFSTDIIKLVADRDKCGIKRFLLRRCILGRAAELAECDEVVFWEDIAPAHLKFTTGSGSVIWALNMDYSDIFLIGIDCNYRAPTSFDLTHEQNNNVSNVSPVEDYFFDGYIKQGDSLHRSSRSTREKNEKHLEQFVKINLEISGLNKRIFVSSQHSALYDRGIYPYKPIPGTEMHLNFI